VKLEPSTSGAIPEQPHDPTADDPGRSNPFALTPVQVEMKVSELGYPPGTHAASIFLQAQYDSSQNEIKDAEGVLGIVALLGAVEGEQLNRSVFNIQK